MFNIQSSKDKIVGVTFLLQRSVVWWSL